MSPKATSESLHSNERHTIHLAALSVQQSHSCLLQDLLYRWRLSRLEPQTRIGGTRPPGGEVGLTCTNQIAGTDPHWEGGDWGASRCFVHTNGGYPQPVPPNPWGTEAGLVPVQPFLNQIDAHCRNGAPILRAGGKLPC